MPSKPGPPVRRALVASYQSVADDPRPAKQVAWLESAGYRVDVLSRGGVHPGASGRHTRIPFPPLPVRLAAYALLPSPVRFRFMVGSRIPAAALPAASEKYELVIVHDMDLLPWAVAHASELIVDGGDILIDLHEYFEGYGTGFAHRVLFERYQRWLFEFIASPVFTIRTTVADGIADLYAERLGVPRPVVVRNAPPYERLEPSPVDPDRIRLIYHGRADLSRGLVVVVDAFSRLDDRFELTFMVVGTDSEIAALRALVPSGDKRIRFRNPVPMREVAAAINEYDAEVVFYPPATANLKFFLPNKFFEAVQGRLAIITGDSPSIASIVREYGNGRVITAGWGPDDLADVLTRLDADAIREMKRRSAEVAAEYNAERECERFLGAIGVAG